MGQPRVQLRVALGVASFLCIVLGAAFVWSSARPQNVAAASVPESWGPAALPAPDDSALVEVSPSETGDSRAAAEQAVPVRKTFDVRMLGASQAQSPTEVGVVTGMSGKVVLYIEGQPSRSIFDGSVRVTVQASRRRSSAVEITVPVKGSRFEVPLRQRADGTYTTMDREHELGVDPARIRFAVAAPRADSLKPLLLFNPGTGAPWHYGPQIGMGTTDAIIDVCEAPTVELDVFEKGTSRHLDSVKVIIYRPPSANLRGGRSPAALRLAWFEPSPLLLTPGPPESLSQAVEVEVEAPGYGTKRMTIDFRQAGKRTAELEPAGQLAVRILGDLPGGSGLRLNSFAFQDTRILSGPETHFRDLAPGLYRIALYGGDLLNHPGPLVAGHAEIKAGEQTELTLEIPDEEPAPLTTVRGTLVLPGKWGLQARRMQAQMTSPRRAATVSIPASQVKPVEGRTDEFFFELEELEVGDYVFSLPELCLHYPVRVPPEGLHNLRFVAPPPVHVTVVTRPAAGMEESTARLRSVYWQARTPGEDWPNSMKGASATRDPHRHAMRVPACEIRVEAASFGSSQNSIEFFATDGLVVELEVNPPISFTVELKDGDRVLPWPPGTMAKITIPGESESPRYSTSRPFGTHGSPTYRLSETGTYRITVPKVDGYLPHEDVEFTLSHGAKQKVVVQMTPR